MNQSETKAAKTPKKARVIDNRPPEVIFKERFNEQARLMTRRFDALKALGNAKRAQPTEEQLEAAIQWMEEQFQATVTEMRRKFDRNNSSAKEFDGVL